MLPRPLRDLRLLPQSLLNLVYVWEVLGGVQGGGCRAEGALCEHSAAQRGRLELILNVISDGFYATVSTYWYQQTPTCLSRPSPRGLLAPPAMPEARGKGR